MDFLLTHGKLIGTVVVGAVFITVAHLLFKRNSSNVISPNEYRKFKLISKTSLTKADLVGSPVNLYRFEIEGDRPLGLPIGKHISIRAKIGNDQDYTYRSYTPTSSNDDKGYFDLVIKVYPKGKLTNYIDSLQIGDCIEVAGPKGPFEYEKNKYKAIGMLAGGTGITPMLQIITEILKHEDDKTQVTLLYGNVTVHDIILRERIDELSAKHSNFKVYHVLNEAPEGWAQGKGFITRDLIAEHFPSPSENVRILMCGPPPMLKAMKDHLTALSYTKEQIFTF